MNEIDPKKTYTIKDIFNNGWVLNTAGKPDRQYIWNLVRNHVIRGQAIATAKRRTIWLIAGADIIKYLNNEK